MFDSGHGLILAGKSDWTLDLRITPPGDDSWLGTYDYEFEGARWQLRDASGEDPFAAAMNARLSDWEPISNEAPEVVGLRLSFGEIELWLNLLEGEITTKQATMPARAVSARQWSSL